MLLSSSALLSLPVMSLQVGKEIARTSRAIVDPADLSIIAYEVSGPRLDNTPSFLRIEDVRELSDIGFIIDSSDELIGLGDIVNKKAIYESDFELVGMKVLDEKRKKLGKISHTTLNPQTFLIEQLNVAVPFFKSFGDTELLIHRKQIIEINDNEIIVRRPTIKAKPEPKKDQFVNPFRKSAEPQPEAINQSQH